MTTFPAAPLDRSTKLISAAFVVALFGVALTVPPAAESRTAAIVAWAISGGLIGLAWGFSPRAYELTADGRVRVIRRLFGSRAFPLEAAQAVPEALGLGGIRLFGSGGAFGWYGLFWRKGVGRYRAYVTDRRLLVACTGAKGLVIISPADPDAFLALAPTPEVDP